LIEFVKVSSVVTHTDPKAFYGALAVAMAARHGVKNEKIRGEVFLQEVAEQLCGDATGEMMGLLQQAVLSAERGESLENFMRTLGLSEGISGYVYHTVPCVIQVWLRRGDNYRAAVTEIVRAGGDTDTTAAILGGIIGSRVGKDGIPSEWLCGIKDYPRSVAWLERLASTLGNSEKLGQGVRGRDRAVSLVLLRNFCFMVIVLMHGFRRLFPPY
jgi:ADP-ribosylglycohydrolase